MNTEAAGWMPVDDVTEAIKGWEIEVDKAWYRKRQTQLIKELAEITEVLHELNCV